MLNLDESLAGMAAFGATSLQGMVIALLGAAVGILDLGLPPGLDRVFESEWSQLGRHPQRFATHRLLAVFRRRRR